MQIGKPKEIITIEPREEPVPTAPPRFVPASPRKPVREPVTV